MRDSSQRSRIVYPVSFSLKPRIIVDGGLHSGLCLSVLHTVDIFIRLYLFSHVYQVSSVSFGKGNVLLFYFMYLLSPVMLPCLFVSVSNFTNTTNTYIFP